MHIRPFAQFKNYCNTSYIVIFHLILLYYLILIVFFFQSVSPSESGFYSCVSKKISGTGITVGNIEMIVKGSTFSAIDAVKLVAIVVSIIVLIACAVIYFRLRKQWSKYDGRAVVPGG